MPGFGEGISILYPDFDGLVPGENPLRDGDKWGEYSTRFPLKVGDEGGAIHGTVEFAVNGSVYKESVFVGNVIEGYGCSSGGQLGAALESWRVVALIGDPNAYIGYSSGFGGGIGKYFFFRRYDGSGFTTLGELGMGGGYPSRLGIRLTPTHVQQWAAFGSGPWELIQEFGDDNHRGVTRIALETEEQGGIEEVGWVCFGAGVPRRTQFFRWTRGYKEFGFGE